MLHPWLVGLALATPVDPPDEFEDTFEDTGLGVEERVVHPPPPAFHCTRPCGPDAQWVVHIPDLDMASVTPQSVTVTPPIVGTVAVHPTGFSVSGARRSDTSYTLRLAVRNLRGEPIARTHSITTGPHARPRSSLEGRHTIAAGESLGASVAGSESVQVRVRRLSSGAGTTDAPGPVILEETLVTDPRGQQLTLPAFPTPGTYAVELHAEGTRPIESLVRVTDLSVEVFSDVLQRLVRVHDAHTGRPARKARIGGTRADEHGVVRLPAGTDAIEVRHGREVVVMGSPLRLSGTAHTSGRLWEAQGTYRPGDTIAVRGLFRSHASGASGALSPAGPGSASYALQIGRFTREGQVDVSPTGTFAFDIVLPDDLEVGFGIGSVGIRMGDARAAANVFIEQPPSRPLVPRQPRDAPEAPHARVISTGTDLTLQLRRPPGSSVAQVAVTRFGAVELFTAELAEDAVEVPLIVDGDQGFDVEVAFVGDGTTTAERIRYTPQPLSIVRTERTASSLEANVVFADATSGELVAWITAATADQHAVPEPFEWSPYRQAHRTFSAPVPQDPILEPGPLRVHEAATTICGLSLGPYPWKLPSTDRVSAMSPWTPLVTGEGHVRLPADPEVDYILHVVGHDGAGRVAHAQVRVPTTSTPPRALDPSASGASRPPQAAPHPPADRRPPRPRDPDRPASPPP